MNPDRERKNMGQVQTTLFMNITILSLLVFSLTSCSDISGNAELEKVKQRTIIDSRGFEVEVPLEIRRVVSISDGLVEGVMQILGEGNKLVGIGSTCLVREFNYQYKLESGRSVNFEKGMNPLRYINPELTRLPVVVQSGTGINLEVLTGLKPDVVIIRVGDCSVGNIDESFDRTLQILDQLNIPVVVLLATHLLEEQSADQITEEIEIIGNVFGKEAEARLISETLERKVGEIKSRIVDKTEKKPSVLLLGLSGRSGAVANVMGKGTIESSFVEDVIKAKNAFPEPGHFRILNAEQILVLDPDIIVLYTAAGYHPPIELYQAPEFKVLRNLKAVKNRRVVALPWTPCNCDKRLEYPLDLLIIASATYPEAFQDLDVGEWILQFYSELYGVGREEALKLRSYQWLNWTVE